MDKNEINDIIADVTAAVGTAETPPLTGADDGYEWQAYVYVGARITHGDTLVQRFVPLCDAGQYIQFPDSIAPVSMNLKRGKKGILPSGTVGGVYWLCTDGEGSFYMGGHHHSLGATYITRLHSKVCGKWTLSDRSAKDTVALAKDAKREQERNHMHEMLEPLRMELSKCRNVRQRRMMMADIMTHLMS